MHWRGEERRARARGTWANCIGTRVQSANRLANKPPKLPDPPLQRHTQAPYAVEVRLTDNVDDTDSPPKMFEYTPSNNPVLGSSHNHNHSHSHTHTTSPSTFTPHNSAPHTPRHDTDQHQNIPSAPSMAMFQPPMAAMSVPPGQHSMG